MAGNIYLYEVYFLNLPTIEVAKIIIQDPESHVITKKKE